MQKKKEKGIKRRKGKPTDLFLIKIWTNFGRTFHQKLDLKQKKIALFRDKKIHNFRHFMDFPDVLKNIKTNRTNFFFRIPSLTIKIELPM